MASEQLPGACQNTACSFASHCRAATASRSFSPERWCRPRALVLAAASAPPVSPARCQSSGLRQNPSSSGLTTRSIGLAICHRSLQRTQLMQAWAEAYRLHTVSLPCTLVPAPVRAAPLCSVALAMPPRHARTSCADPPRRAGPECAPRSTTLRAAWAQPRRRRIRAARNCRRRCAPPDSCVGCAPCAPRRGTCVQ